MSGSSPSSSRGARGPGWLLYAPCPREPLCHQRGRSSRTSGTPVIAPRPEAAEASPAPSPLPSVAHRRGQAGSSPRKSEVGGGEACAERPGRPRGAAASLALTRLLMDDGVPAAPSIPGPSAPPWAPPAPNATSQGRGINLCLGRGEPRGEKAKHEKCLLPGSGNGAARGEGASRGAGRRERTDATGAAGPGPQGSGAPQGLDFRGGKQGGCSTPCLGPF